MGITGLLQGLKPFTREANVRDFENQSVAIDTSSWLHKSVYSIADHYVEAMEDNARHCRDRKCIETSSRYIVKRCQELLTYAKIRRIYLVMDGIRCPLKAPTNQDREQKRQQALAEARALRRRGGAKQYKIFEKYKTCIKITDEFSRVVVDRAMQELRGQRVERVRSPYEADAQLVELCAAGIAQAVITEDSDVLVYSAACRVSFPVLFKLDRNSGSCQVLSMSWMLDPKTNQQLVEKYKTSRAPLTALELIVTKWMQQEKQESGKGSSLFVQACVLAGCDYAPSQLSGVGLVNAFKLIDRQKQSKNRFKSALREHQSSRRAGTLNTSEYEELLSKAEIVFYHHPVLKQKDQRIDHLISLDNENDLPGMPSIEKFRNELETILGSLKGTVQHKRTTRPDTLLSFFPASKSDDVSSLSSQSAPPPVKQIAIATGKHGKGKDNKQKKPAPRKQTKIRTNPYAKQQQPRTCELDKSRRQSPQKPNPFDGYRHKTDGKENEVTANAKTTYTRQDDVRYVKPQFAKDGSRIKKLEVELPKSKPKPDNGPVNKLPVVGSSSFRKDGSRIQNLGMDLVNGKKLTNGLEQFTGAEVTNKVCTSDHRATDMINQPQMPFASGFEEESDDVLQDPQLVAVRNERGINRSGAREISRFDEGKLLDSLDKTDPPDDESIGSMTIVKGVLDNGAKRASEGSYSVSCPSDAAASLPPTFNEPTEPIGGDSDSSSVDDLPENENIVKSSKYFSAPSQLSRPVPVRRVTMEDAEAQSPKKKRAIYHVDIPRSSPPYEFEYDEFLSPKKPELNSERELWEEDDIVDDSPEVLQRQPKLQMHRTVPSHTLGSARTMHNRFGADGKRRNASASGMPSKPIERAFKRQQEQAVTDSNCGLRKRINKSKYVFSKRRKHSNTLHEYFNPSP